MAGFCLTTGMTPGDFKQLTLIELEAFLEVLNGRKDNA